MAFVGYARVSTDEQNLDLQRNALQDARCDLVFEDDGYSAIDTHRPGFALALDALNTGDVLVVWKMDRAFRSLKNALDTLEVFEAKGFELRCLTEPIDTTTPFGKFVYQIRNVFAELERNIIRERTIAGMEAARARGVTIGRPRKLSEYQVSHAQRVLSENRSANVQTIADELGVAPVTLLRSLKRYKAVTPELVSD